VIEAVRFPVAALSQECPACRRCRNPETPCPCRKAAYRPRRAPPPAFERTLSKCSHCHCYGTSTVASHRCTKTSVEAIVVVSLRKILPEPGPSSPRFLISRSRLQTSVTAIPVQEICRRWKFVRRAVGTPGSAASLAVLCVPIPCSGLQKVQVPIIVEIEEARRDRPTSAPRLLLWLSRP